jgi:hypothetical protein
MYFFAAVESAHTHASILTWRTSRISKDRNPYYSRHSQGLAVALFSEGTCDWTVTHCYEAVTFSC